MALIKKKLKDLLSTSDVCKSLHSESFVNNESHPTPDKYEKMVKFAKWICTNLDVDIGLSSGGSRCL